MWAQEITLESDTQLSTEGYFVISWVSASDTSNTILLQQSPSENFGTTITREFSLPANSSITITGLDNGTYYFRALETGASGFSNTVAVEVAHHSLLRALTFFSVGLMLFLILVGTIIKGQRGLRESGDA